MGEKRTGSADIDPAPDVTADGHDARDPAGSEPIAPDNLKVLQQ